jgi:hypothetical protein
MISTCPTDSRTISTSFWARARSDVWSSYNLFWYFGRLDVPRRKAFYTPVLRCRLAYHSQSFDFGPFFGNCSLEAKPALSLRTGALSRHLFQISQGRRRRNHAKLAWSRHSLCRSPTKSSMQEHTKGNRHPSFGANSQVQRLLDVFPCGTSASTYASIQSDQSMLVRVSLCPRDRLRWNPKVQPIRRPVLARICRKLKAIWSSYTYSWLADCTYW